MNQFNQSIIVIASMFAGSLVGGGLVEHNRNTEATEAWRDVMVVQGGTLVANPAALTPAELADADILKREPRLIGFNCNGRTLTGEKFSDFPIFDCKEVATVEAAMKEAR